MRRASYIGPSQLCEAQEAFCLALVVDQLRPSEAYRKAYPNTTAKNSSRIAILAANLKKHPKVIARIRELLEPTMLERDLTVRRIADSVANALYCDPAEMFDDNNALLPLKEMPPRVRDAIEGIEFKEGLIVKIKLSSKATAREQAMRYRGMFEKDNAQKFSTMNDEQLEARIAKILGADSAAAKVLATMREKSEIPKDW